MTKKPTRRLVRHQLGDDHRYALVGGTAILPDRLIQDSYIEWRHGLLTCVRQRPEKIDPAVQVIDTTGSYISPGWIDIHVHGGGGADFMDGVQQAISIACHTHLAHGTTTIFPTTTTGSQKSILKMIDATKATIEWHRTKSANSHPTSKRISDPSDVSPWIDLPTIEGIHLYGPYFAPDKSGCHKKEGCRAPRKTEFEKYFRSGLIKIATCAAELEGAVEFYRYAKKQGCLVTCGHSNSSWNEMKIGHKNGMSHVDHFWCAMSSVPSVRSRLGTPMQGSMLEFVLAHDTMSTEVIADGHHLAPELLEFAWKMKGPGKLCLVSDTSRALDCPPGRYAFGHPDEGVWIESNGQVGLSPSGGLASSVVALDHCVRHVVKATSIPLWDVIRMASLTPAERTGIASSRGSLEVGKVADLLVLSKKLVVQQVYFRGVF